MFPEFSRPEGGFLHVHNNVKDVEEASWIDYLVSSLKTMSSVLGEYMSYLCHSNSLTTDELIELIENLN